MEAFDASADSSPPNARLLGHLAVAQSACLVVVGGIAAIVLVGWLVPSFGSELPVGWSLMKANSALALALCAASFALTQPARAHRQVLAGRLCAAVVIVLATTALLGHLTGATFAVETWLAADRGAATPGRLSIQTALFLVLLGFALALDGNRHRARAVLADVLTGALVLIPIVILAGYSFGAANLFGQSSFTRTSPQTLVCLTLLGASAVVRRTQHGFFSVLVGSGIGSQSSRIALPFALLLPFLIVSSGAFIAVSGWLSAPYAAALTSSATSMMSCVFVVLMARRINGLERDLRKLSFTDALTRLHNLRSFHLLGEHTFREGRRDAQQVAVLFFDVDGLKAVNDRLGHDVGSRLVVAFADLLRGNFRNSDVVARVGGDEFAVVTKAGKSELTAALLRLERATTAANLAGDRPFQISYSVGDAIAEPTGRQSFTELVDSADAAMYVRKQLKRRPAEPVDLEAHEVAARAIA